MVLKINLLGLSNAGKTTLIRHILEGKEFEELENLPPTEGINTNEYRYRRLVEISVFDCGGQEQFLEGYFSETMERTVFSNVRVFFWVIDVSDINRLEESRSWFKKAFESLKQFSPDAKIYVLANKYDKKDKIPKNELKEFFTEQGPLADVTFHTTSVKSKTARTIICRILNALIEKTETLRIKNLQKITDGLISRLNAKLIMLINKDDGLEINSSIGPEIETKLIDKEAIEFLQYLSVKTLIYPINIARDLVEQFREKGFLNSKGIDTTIFKLDEEYIFIRDIHKSISIFIATPIMHLSIDRFEQEIAKITPKLLEILKIS
jgi:Ras-related GTP-binding protein A/B